MDKLERPRGLIRYSSSNKLAGHPGKILRPRVYLYTGLLILGAVVAFFGFREHTSFEANLQRLPGPPYVIDDDSIRDSFEVRLVNKTSGNVTYLIEPEPVAGVTFVVPLARVDVPPMGNVRSPVFVTISKVAYKADFPDPHQGAARRRQAWGRADGGRAVPRSQEVTALLLAALTLGFLGSTHCVAMCGGIVSVLAAGAAPNLRRSERPPLLRIVLYSVGRIGSYALAGAAVGALSLLVRDALPVRVGQMALRGGAGLLMLALGLHLTGLFRGFTVLERAGAPLWRRIEPAAKRLLPVRSGWHALALGAVWGWVPCGMVYTALALAAATGSAPGGALAMGIFGAGTLPAMVLAGVLARGVSSRMRGAQGLWAPPRRRRRAGELRRDEPRLCAGIVPLRGVAQRGRALRSRGAGRQPLGTPRATFAGMSGVRILTVTVSDTRTETDDVSGARLAALLAEAGFDVRRHLPVMDDVDIIVDVVRTAASEADLDVVILTGGTGITPRDVTPEAVESVLEKRLDGFGEEFRRRSWDQIGPRAMLSRATAGVLRGSVIVSLPGSVKAVELGVALLAPILPHMVDLATGRATRHP